MKVPKKQNFEINAFKVLKSFSHGIKNEVYLSVKYQYLNININFQFELFVFLILLNKTSAIFYKKIQNQPNNLILESSAK